MDSEDEDAGIRVFAPEGPHDQHGYPRCSARTGRESQGDKFTAQKHDEEGDNNPSSAKSQGSDSQNENISTQKAAVDDISYASLQSLSHEEICKILNVNKEKLMAQLKSIEPHVRQILSKLPLEGFGISQDQSWSEERLMKSVASAWPNLNIYPDMGQKNSSLPEQGMGCKNKLVDGYLREADGCLSLIRALQKKYHR